MENFDYYLTVWKARSGKEKESSKYTMKIRIYEITQTKHSDTRGSVGFTSACFAFAVGFLLISPAPDLHVQNVTEQLFPSKEPFSQPSFGSHRCVTRVARLSLLPESRTDRGRAHTTSPSLSLYGDTNWKPLFSLPCLSLYLSLCSCLLSVELSV